MAAVAVQPTEVEVTPDQRRCWVHFSHMSFDDFGRTDTLQHWKVPKVFESARFFSLMRFLDLRAFISHQHGLFVMGIHYSFKPTLWQVPKGMDFPYKVSFEMTDIGRTSFTVYSQMVNKLDDQELASCLCKLVHVDRTTRRPVPFPDWFMQKYVAIIEKKRPLVFRTPPEVSADSHSYDVTVAASDTDGNGHTNHVSYIQFCCNVAQVAVKAGTLHGYQTDLARYPLLEQEVQYVGESSMGDKLQVLLWQQPEHQERVCFVIRRQKDGNQYSAVFHAYMIFGLMQIPRPRI